MNALFLQLLLWFIVCAGLGVIAGWILAKLYTPTPKPHSSQHALAHCQQQLKQQQQVLQQTQDELEQYQQQATVKTHQENTAPPADCQAYEEKIAKLEKALLDVLKNRQ